MSGYVMLPSWLLQSKPSGNAVLIYATLASFGTFDTGAGVYEECRPALATVAERTGMSLSNVKRAIAELLELGAVTRAERFAEDGRTQLPSVYRVIFGCLAGPGGSAGGPPPPSAGEPRGGPPVDHNQEPSTKNQDTKMKGFADESAPTAQTILAAFIDWLALPMQGSVKLSKRVIGMYAKAIKELLDEGFDGVLIRRALAAMYDRGLTDRPTLLHGLVVQVQAARPTSGGAKSFVQQADEYKQAKSNREDVVLSVMQELIDFAEREHGQQLSATKARKIVNGWIDSGQIELNGLSVSVPSLYSGYVEIAGEAEEVS